jgi:hypothetical protein
LKKPSHESLGEGADIKEEAEGFYKTFEIGYHPEKSRRCQAYTIDKRICKSI